MPRVDFFHVGPQKSGTTWLYECLKGHPKIGCAARDSVHYFDMFHHLGVAWYVEQFPSASTRTHLIDFTPSYLRSPWAPRRIARYNPDARILLCLRDPIERAFSHYWHEKKKGKYNFGFDEVLSNYDLFSSWIEPGLYAEHIERFLTHFDRSRILVQDFRVLRRSPAAYLDQTLEFIGVDRSYRPEILTTRINPAGSKQRFRNSWILRLRSWLSRFGISRRWPSLDQRLSGQREYLLGVPDTVRTRLAPLCEPEIERLERLLDLNLKGWRDQR